VKIEKPKPAIPRLVDALREFTELESASGMFLVVAAAIAMVFANTGLEDLYQALLNTRITIAVGNFEISKHLLLWINDGLMTVFFFLVGLEIKREILQGELSDVRRTALPLAAAAGGMAAPALIYAAMNWGDAQAMNGWAVPTATDIAFALGVLALLGERVPNALKVFLLTLAIADDLGAIVIIALFYSDLPSLLSLAVAVAAYALLVTLNLRGVVGVAPYLLIGVVLWVAVLKSGVHATIAGVLLAFTIPLRTPRSQPSPLLQLEHDLNAPVAFGILPLFAFANAGVPFADMTWRMMIHPVPLGIAAGLFFGKQLGVFVFSWLAVRIGLAQLPQGVGWRQLYGVAALCGIGFTMSLFIGKLAFVDEGPGALAVDERSGILLGSLVSALLGYAVLRLSTSSRRKR
jgi:Na+:H+ antiporter, NhaA family